MKLFVLVSCMNQIGYDIIQRINIQTDAVIINQCDTNMSEDILFTNKSGKLCKVRFISTMERGLSKSRNMAIQNAVGADICLLCDDDEVLADDYEKVIKDAYNRIDSDMIAFSFHYTNRNRNNFIKRTRINYMNFWRICSVQITFKRNAIVQNGIKFDEEMGSGTGNGGGEENKFVADCLKNRMSIFAEPQDIAEITYDINNSNWFEGFNKAYFINKGWSNRRVFGLVGAIIFSLVFCIRRVNIYYHQMNPFCVFFYQMKGVFLRK